MSIFLIDPHPLMREAMGAVVRRLRAAGTVTELDRLSAVARAQEAHGTPELLCIELVLPDSSGVSGVVDLRQRFPDVPIVVLSALPGQEYADLSMKAGANAYLHKSASVSEITEVLRVFLSDSLDAEASTPIEKLSKRQKQLLSLIDKGMSNRDIAETLQISEHTVKVHLWRLFRRLEVKSRSQASHLARTRGLI